MRETKLLGILTNLRGEIQKMGWNAYAEENCVTKREGKRPIMVQGATKPKWGINESGRHPVRLLRHIGQGSV